MRVAKAMPGSSPSVRECCSWLNMLIPVRDAIEDGWEHYVRDGLNIKTRRDTQRVFDGQVWSGRRDLKAAEGASASVYSHVLRLQQAILVSIPSDRIHRSFSSPRPDSAQGQ